MLKISILAGASLISIAVFTLPALADDRDGPDSKAPPSRPAFSDIDTNKDGVISQAEFDAYRPAQAKRPPAHAFHRHGPHDHGPHDLKALDANGDGQVTFEEFSAPLKARFDRLDTNHDGVLSGDELTPGHGGPDEPPSPPPPPGK